jgi:hypothetical protein
MKKAHILAGAILIHGLWASAAIGQAPVPPAAAAAAADPGAAAAAKPTFCDRLDKACDKCRRKICASPLGGMLNAITKPASIATGGIIPNFCPAMPSDDDLKKPGAAGAANLAMKDALEASARRKAVRMLGTFDCHWYPEAEVGLAAALRTDRAECVRLEAAIALNRGCCCTRLIVEALEDCVGGTDKLGPSENSCRVQAFAARALDRCLCCPEAMAVIEEPVPVNDGKELREETRPPTEPGAKPVPPPMPLTPQGSPSFGPTAKSSGKPTRAEIEHARQTLALAKARIGRNVEAAQPTIPSGQRSIAGLANYVFHGAPTVQQPSTLPPAAAPVTMPAVARSSTQPGAASFDAPRPAPISVARTEAPKPVPESITLTDVPALPSSPAPAAMAPAKQTAPAKVESAKGAMDPAILRSLETLRDSHDPEARHAAIRALASCDWREHPEALAGLLYAARYDHHAGMRVAAIRLLVSIKAATPEVIVGLKPLLNDKDEWIRHETTQALGVLQTSLTSHSAEAAH